MGALVWTMQDLFLICCSSWRVMPALFKNNGQTSIAFSCIDVKFPKQSTALLSWKNLKIRKNIHLCSLRRNFSKFFLHDPPLLVLQKLLHVHENWRAKHQALNCRKFLAMSQVKFSPSMEIWQNFGYNRLWQKMHGCGTRFDHFFQCVGTQSDCLYALDASTREKKVHFRAKKERLAVYY